MRIWAQCNAFKKEHINANNLVVSIYSLHEKQTHSPLKMGCKAVYVYLVLFFLLVIPVFAFAIAMAVYPAVGQAMSMYEYSSFAVARICAIVAACCLGLMMLIVASVFIYYCVQDRRMDRENSTIY